MRRPDRLWLTLWQIQATTGKITTGDGKWVGTETDFSQLGEEQLKQLPIDSLLWEYVLYVQVVNIYLSRTTLFLEF